MAAAQAKGGTLIAGGGFAGSCVARRLGRRGAPIVSPENFMRFTPMLPEAASGTLEPRHVVVPLRALCPHADLVLGRVSAHDPAERRVQIETEERVFWLHYADLVVALGAVARTLPIPGLAEHALGFKTSQHALRQAKRLAKNLAGERRPYRYRTLGEVATLGRYKGVASVFGFPLKGFLGWWVTRTNHLYQLPLLSRKLRVVTDWTVALFFRRDIAELGVLERPRRLGG